MGFKDFPGFLHMVAQIKYKSENYDDNLLCLINQHIYPLYVEIYSTTNIKNVEWIMREKICFTSLLLFNSKVKVFDEIYS